MSDNAAGMVVAIALFAACFYNIVMMYAIHGGY
jgi:hypothetical protein